jgi:hypothetical protein
LSVTIKNKLGLTYIAELLKKWSLKITILINNKEYPDGTIFRVGVAGEFKLLSGVEKGSEKREITNLPVGFLQPGMTLINGKEEELIKYIVVEPEEKRTPFYHMHIYKTSGLSIQMDLMEYFDNLQVYRNFIGFLDNKIMLSSSFVSGHFASYPIDLYLKHNKKYHAFTLLRDPIERCVSHYLYENRIHHREESDPDLDSFEEFIELNKEILKDLQSKNVTSSMDLKLAKRISMSALNQSMSIGEAFEALGDTSRFISPITYEDEWESHIDKFSLIGTIENRDKFREKLHSLIQSEGYRPRTINNNYVNKNYYSTSNFTKSLPQMILLCMNFLNQEVCDGKRIKAN